MTGTSSQPTSLAARVANFSLSHPIVIFSFLLLIVAIFIWGVIHIKTETGYRTFIDEGHPDLIRFDRFIQRFGGGYPILIVYSCYDAVSCKDVFDPVPLSMAHELAGTLEELPGVRSVFTPATAELMVPVDDGFEVRTFYRDGALVSDRESLAEVAKKDPLWQRTIIAEQGRVGAITIQLETTDSDVQTETTKAAYAALKPYQERGFEFRLVGKAVDFVIAPEFVQSEAAKVMPAMVIVLICVLYILFRSVVAVLLSLLVMGISSLVSQGILGLFDIPLDAVTSNAATIVFVVAVCDAVHFLAHYADRAHREGAESRIHRVEILLRVANHIGGACLLTTLTTIVALMSFVYTGYRSFVGFGISSSLGIFSALILTFTLLPILVSYFDASGFTARRHPVCGYRSAKSWPFLSAPKQKLF